MPRNKRGKPSRDYKAEYARRIELGKDRGFDRSQARGHPKRGSISVKKSHIVREVLQLARHDTSRHARDMLVGLSTVMHDEADAAAELDRYSNNEELFIKMAVEVGWTLSEAYELWWSP